ncbi:hypothetical protein AMTR_s00063p00183550 [Amborella trichopoda]|uniref:Uncharacterized protein n=1 Tax=Amborella trichopoda TaxID=13333 RepID=U5D1G9_AMBTC|nr:hypothetical protein AMTR_s00063p00183550 [Amborella trichopoda]
MALFDTIIDMQCFHMQAHVSHTRQMKRNCKNIGKESSHIIGIIEGDSANVFSPRKQSIPMSFARFEEPTFSERNGEADQLAKPKAYKEAFTINHS